MCVLRYTNMPISNKFPKHHDCNHRGFYSYSCSNAVLVEIENQPKPKANRLVQQKQIEIYRFITYSSTHHS